MRTLSDASVHLVVTSPPYPMIEMWDEIMWDQNGKIRELINSENGEGAFELMHKELDKVWSEVHRVLAPGGIACINIGDATRTIGGRFALYPNHSRIISAFMDLGFQNLPNILWRKQTNAPNKFMGSGMMPCGAYITLEHEWILIFRKEGQREYKTPAARDLRKKSCFFWEERNVWFSDLWELRGVGQKVNNSGTRKRSAAYPFEVPYRLINMYSIEGDTVLDPFLGTGTTVIAAIASKRNSIGYEIDPDFREVIQDNMEGLPLDFYNETIRRRLEAHKKFVLERELNPRKGPLRHFNKDLGVKVMTRQETSINLDYLSSIEWAGDDIVAQYDSTICSGESFRKFQRSGRNKVLF